MIYLGSDHAGFEAKEKIKRELIEKGESVEDLGANNDNPSDYPKFARLVAEKVAGDPSAKGILFCRSGQGTAITANRFRGVRAVVAWNSESARESRNDNDSNILSIPAGYLKIDEIIKIINVWLVTPASKEERHIKRIRDIDK